MPDVPAWHGQQSTVQQGLCDPIATHSVPVEEGTRTSSSLPAVRLNHAATYCMGRGARLSVADDKHVKLDGQPLPSSTSEAPAVSGEVTRGYAIVSNSARTCLCPVCLDLRTNSLSSKVSGSGNLPRYNYSCRLPACDSMG